MKRNFTITSDINNKKKHNSIKKFITKDLLRHRNLLINDLKIILYDYEDYNNITALCSRKGQYKIDLNLAQIFRLYKTGNRTLNRIDKKHLPKFKSFKNYLLFVLYHELGHYNLKHCFDRSYYLEHRTICEIEADKFSLKILNGAI